MSTCRGQKEVKGKGKHQKRCYATAVVLVGTAKVPYCAACAAKFPPETNRLDMNRGGK